MFRKKTSKFEPRNVLKGMSIFLGFGMIGLAGNFAITPDEPSLLFPKDHPTIVVDTITGQGELKEQHEKEKQSIKNALQAIARERDTLYNEKVSRGELDRAQTLKREKVINSISKHLGGVFKNKATYIYSISKGFEVNPMLLAAIAKWETANGTSQLVKIANNPGGLNWFKGCGYPKSGWYQKYPTIEVGILQMAKLLKENYIDQGLTSIDKIGAKYAPLKDSRNGIGGMDNSKWVVNVTKYYNQMLEDAES